MTAEISDTAISESELQVTKTKRMRVDPTLRFVLREGKRILQIADHVSIEFNEDGFPQPETVKWGGWYDVPLVDEATGELAVVGEPAKIRVQPLPSEFASNRGNKQFRVTKTLTVADVPFLNDFDMESYPLIENNQIPEGTVVFDYGGATYGVVSPAGRAVTLEDGKTPFLELPRQFLQEI